MYNSKKIQRLVSCLDSLTAANNMFRDVQVLDCQNNKLLTNTFKFESNGGQNVNLEDKLDFFKKAFNHEKALKEGKIIPKKGVAVTKSFFFTRCKIFQRINLTKEKNILINIKVALFTYYHNVCCLFFVLHKYAKTKSKLIFLKMQRAKGVIPIKKTVSKNFTLIK